MIEPRDATSSVSPQFARAALVGGALLGVLIAVRGVVRPSHASTQLPADAAAIVGTVPVPLAEYERAVAAVEADRRDHRADADLRRHVLDRLIDEELLVQAAIELGMPTRDPRLRGQVASAMLEGLVGASTPPPSDDELRAFHASHAASFSRRGRVRFDAAFFRGDGAAARAEGARARLNAAEPFSLIAAEADPSPAVIPAVALPVSKIAEYAGPSVAKAVESLPPQAPAVVVVDRGAWVVQLVSREGGELAPFDDVRDEVLAEWRHDDDDRRLRHWLDARAAATKVIRREALP
jgi:hypothetical protein